MATTLTNQEKEYLENILSRKFYDKLTRIDEMELIVSILSKNGINTKQMSSDLEYYTKDLISK
jgi:hypothetical protein